MMALMRGWVSVMFRHRRGARLAMRLAFLPLLAATMGLGPFVKDPDCDHPRVERQIIDGFNHRLNDLSEFRPPLVQLDREKQIAYRELSGTGSFVSERYCRAIAEFAAADPGTVYYVVRSKGSSLLGYSLEWCMEGFDEGDGDDPTCRAQRPPGEEHIITP